MKVKRFVAQDMRQAIRLVRETLGPDAVILSNKTVDGGVELMAAVDLEPAGLTETVDQRIASRPAAGAAPRRSEAPVRPGGEPAAADDPLAAMRREMQELRRLMENELGQLSWRDLGQRRPLTRELLRRLMGLGLAADLARSLVERVGDINEPELAWRKLLYALAAELRVFENELLDRGGVVALVGPTGVGKTTTIAKLAARFALRHGHRHVALVTIDNYRIGARDQLHTYGRILNVPVRTAASVGELDSVLEALADRHLVLVDTAGMGARTERFDEQLAMLAQSRHQIVRLLALSATTEPQALERAAGLFGALRPDACVLTKLDEAASLGGVLSTVVRNALPLAFVTDGQRVPEDLQVARAHPLVNRAAELAEHGGAEPDTEYLAFAYAGARVHAQL
ncbi:MAG: flagellar biosynthesis protein FlhF [Pseudomonadota bacterium]|jgi:flagellar biosynthesis protein FlhF